MNYYDELEISRNSSLEDIQKSYKRMARLLHPDLQTDSELRALAEAQMARINGHAAVLLDPATRAEYDRSLEPPAFAPPRPYGRSIRVMVATAFFIGLAAGIIMEYSIQKEGIFPDRLMGYVAYAGAPEQRRASPAQPDTHPARTADKAPLLPLTPASPAESTRDRKPTAGREPSATTAAVPVRAPDGATLPSEPADSKPPGSPPLEAVKAPAALSSPAYAGSWLFVPSRTDLDQSLYPPEFIEMRVSEFRGTLKGSYRARYRVTDSLISPDVSFQFSGPAGPADAQLSWSASNGTRGEVKLRMLSPDSMEVNWYKTEFGNEAGLAAGTAVLMRRSRD